MLQPTIVEKLTMLQKHQYRGGKNNSATHELPITILHTPPEWTFLRALDDRHVDNLVAKLVKDPSVSKLAQPLLVVCFGKFFLFMTS